MIRSLLLLMVGLLLAALSGGCASSAKRPKYVEPAPSEAAATLLGVHASVGSFFGRGECHVSIETVDGMQVKGSAWTGLATSVRVLPGKRELLLHVVGNNYVQAWPALTLSPASGHIYQLRATKSGLDLHLVVTDLGSGGEMPKVVLERRVTGDDSARQNFTPIYIPPPPR